MTQQAPRNWYPDPDDPSQLRFWDGSHWTENRAPAAPPEVPPSSAPPLGHAGRSAAQRLSDTAKASGAAASAARRTLHRTVTDPVLRQAVFTGAKPVVGAVLDGAGVRNRKGEIKGWRVARAATRPRKTISSASAAAASATASQLANHRPRTAPSGKTDEEILSEWPLGDLDVTLARWREGMHLFLHADPADTGSLRSSAGLMSHALAHCIVGVPVLHENDVVETVGSTLSAELEGVDDGDWSVDDERRVRLALAVARRYGIQPEELGGNGELDLLFSTTRNRMRMAMAVCRTGWSCDLALWFKAQ